MNKRTGVKVVAGFSLALGVSILSGNVESKAEEVNKENISQHVLLGTVSENFTTANDLVRRAPVSSAVYKTKYDNGGVNFYYNSAKGKQLLIESFEKGILAINMIQTEDKLIDFMDDLLDDTGEEEVGWSVEIAHFLVDQGEDWLKDNFERLSDKVKKHGNRGTVRVTLTDVLWSSKYDKTW